MLAEVFAEEDFVADGDAFEVGGGIGSEDVVEVGELAGIGGCVVVEPDSEPDGHGDLEGVDRVEDHLGLVAVVAIETEFVGEEGEDGDVTRDVVLAGRVLDAWGG